MRLINADYLEERLDKCVGESGIGLEPVMAMRDIKAMISVMPTVDAIPIEPMCYALARYALPPRYAMKAQNMQVVDNRDRIKMLAKSWEYALRRMMKLGLLDEGGNE